MQLLEQIQSLDFPGQLPATLLQVDQRFDAPKVAHIPTAVKNALESSGILARMKPGATVAVGAGSRGIANLPIIVKAAIDTLRAAGMHPYVVPVMGSHGGATTEGQIDMLAQLGVTQASVGAEIRATMAVRQIGQIADGPALYQGEDSIPADHTLLVSRIKPHTDFRSHLESGPAKMSVIGLGKQKGAEIMHSGGGANFQRYLAPAARIYETNTNLIGALGIVENAYDDTAEIVGLLSSEIGLEKEAKLLEKAKSLMASLPFSEIDILVLKEMGKNISGTGMDTNIISRLNIPRQPENFGNVDVAVITVLDLTKETHGNATGMGLANITTGRVLKQIDWRATYMNVMTSGIWGMTRGHLPLVLPDDKRALKVSVRGCAMPDEKVRMTFIQNTLMLEHFFVSPNMRAEVEAHPRLKVMGEVPLAFDSAGMMLSPWKME